MIDQLLEADLRANGYQTSTGRDTSPVNEEWMGFKRKIAMGLDQIRKLIDNGSLTDIPAEFDRAAHNLQLQGDILHLSGAIIAQANILRLLSVYNSPPHAIID